MNYERWIRQLTAALDTLEVEYLSAKGWTFTPQKAEAIRIWAKKIKGTDFVLSQSMAMHVQEWLDSLGS